VTCDLLSAPISIFPSEPNSRKCREIQNTFYIKLKHRNYNKITQYEQEQYVTVEVGKLCKKLEQEGIAWYKTETMLPLLLPRREYINEARLTTDLSLGLHMPILTLTDEGRQHLPE